VSSKGGQVLLAERCDREQLAGGLARSLLVDLALVLLNDERVQRMTSRYPV